MVKSCDLHVDIWNTFYNIKRLLRIFQLGKCYFSNFSNIHNLKVRQYYVGSNLGLGANLIKKLPGEYGKYVMEILRRVFNQTNLSSNYKNSPENTTEPLWKLSKNSKIKLPQIFPEELETLE